MGVSLHHADGLDSVAQRYVFSLAAGHHLDMEVGARARLVNHWGAQYSADMRDFASVQSALSHAEEEQARVSNAIYEIILAEIERAG
jgi:predicted metalloprotease